jgi:hypothetical protein
MDDPDPRPVPPEKLLPGDCCDSGCARCVRDVYMDQRQAYKKALAAWQQRHPELAVEPGDTVAVDPRSSA